MTETEKVAPVNGSISAQPLPELVPGGVQDSRDNRDSHYLQLEPNTCFTFPLCSNPVITAVSREQTPPHPVALPEQRRKES